MIQHHVDACSGSNVNDFYAAGRTVSTKKRFINWQDNTYAFTGRLEIRCVT